jgi:hypothetical protein
MYGENTMNFWNVFAMFETIREHAERESFCFGNSLVASGAVRKDARQIGHFADPAAVIFSLDLNGEVAHVRIVQRLFTRREVLQPNSVFSLREYEERRPVTRAVNAA